MEIDIQSIGKIESIILMKIVRKGEIIQIIHNITTFFSHEKIFNQTNVN